ncbi:hypothetical protein CAPTEDRAFT_226882 [Capitella teleta]|uniref:Rab-GAP TBC domain-containing protein n=1 Tax=Capitella teleta TaxID=283909 RepID=R7U378_CAPTE|nr:hypothetical protein CAPTEDRAFT_226882 [Capitella teleta]|eukprot:ELU00566.1 hypothetical protein CAPTEDRAFT_226882 [Capitella teleta]
MERQTEKRNFDEFGFVILPQMQEYENERSHEYTAKKKFWKIELTAWDKLLKTWNVSRLRGSSKVTKFVQHGVPIQIRGELWKKLLDIEVIKATVKCTYKEELCQIREQLVDLGISEYGGQKVLDEISEVESESYRVKYKHISLDALRHIFLDLHRSLPTHELFMGETAKAKEGRAALFRVLAAYARYNRSVEYCQGMSVIAAMFLIQTNCDEETAFWCLVSLLDRHKYILGYFHNNMARLQEHADVFSRLLQQRHPEIQIHLAKYEIHPLMYITPWFMVLFTGFACWDTVLACWDLLLLQGHSALFRISLAVMEVNKANILAAKDLCHLLPLLLHPPVSVTHIEDWEISSLQAVLDEEKNEIPDLEHLEKEEMQPETEKSEKPEIG